MSSKVEVGKKNGEGSDKRNKFFEDVETISKSLFSSRNSSSSTAIPRSKSAAKLPYSKSMTKASKDDNLRKDKKSKWHWKAFRALSLGRNRKFHCCFSLQVHLIKGLPPSFDNASLCVKWKRKDELMVTPPAKVIQGVAEFESVLTYTCTVYGSRNGPESSAKYGSKHSMLYVSMLDVPQIDFGKQRIDLTRLLPLTLEELLEEKSSGKWTTSFKLSGSAKGAVMNVSLGYVVVGVNQGVPDVLRQNSFPSNEFDIQSSQYDRSMRRAESLPSFTSQYSPPNVDDEIKDFHEVFPLSKSPLASSGDILNKKFDENNACYPLHNIPKLDVFIDLETIKQPLVYFLTDARKDKPEEHLGNEEKTCSPVPQFDMVQENLDSIKPSSYPLPDYGKEYVETIEERPDNEGNACSPVPESDVFHENLESVKPDGYPLLDCGIENLETIEALVCLSSDTRKDKLDEHPGNEGKPCGPVPEFDVFQENMETVKPGGDPLPECEKENLETTEPLVYLSSDTRKDKAEEHPGNEGKACSPVTEFDVFQENLESFKPDGYPLQDTGKENLETIEPLLYLSSDSRKDKPEEHPGNEGKTCSPVPEFDVVQENLEIVKPSGYPSLDAGKEYPEECEGIEFFVVDQGIEFSSNEQVKLEESIVKAIVDDHTVDTACSIDTAGIQVSFEDGVKHDTQDQVNDGSEEKAVVHEISYKKDDLCTNELILQELESALNKVLDLERVASESPDAMEVKSEYKMRKSYSLDDVTESAISEFLSKLSIDHSPVGMSSGGKFESPREHLLRQFQKDVLTEGFSLFDFDDMDSDSEADDDYDTSCGHEQGNFIKGIESSPLSQDLQKGNLIESHDMSKQKAQMLEKLEADALMHEWGLNEKAFQHSPPKEFEVLASPIHIPPQEPLILPPLAEGLGPFLQTKDGGFLRSMNPSLFRNARSGSKLIMQASNSVVVPVEMGSGIIEILQRLAPVGIEKLSMQAKNLLPLEDITGKTLQQIAWEAMPVTNGTKRQHHLQHNSVTGHDTSCVQRDSKGSTSCRLKSYCNKFSSARNNQTGQEFVSLEDLALLAMDKIEALSMEGLKIQSDMSEEDAPSNIIAPSFGGISARHGKHLLDIKDKCAMVDGIGSLSLSLDEWMRLDSGEFDDISEHTSKLLAAHHANSHDVICGKYSKGQRKCGLLGNNFTVAFMVQLRDPLRNYEAVGTPMLALIQVERVFVPPRQKLHHRSVSEVGSNGEENDEFEMEANKVKDTQKEKGSDDEEGIPQFKITEVHVAGLKREPQRMKLWGGTSISIQQQQAGSRWLLANGMGKSNKNHPFMMKSKAAPKSTSVPVTTNVQPGDTLWSISSRIYGTGTKWKELVALNPHIRNPNIIVRNETIRIH